MPFLAAASSLPHRRSLAMALALIAFAAPTVGCSVDLQQVFGESSGGQGAQGNTGGTGGIGGHAGNGGTSGSGAAGGSTTTTNTGGTTTMNTGGTTTTTTPCGDGTCDPAIGETPQSCPADCPSACGDGTCDPNLGETSQSCPVDCQPGTCAHDLCINGDPLQDGCNQCAASVCAQDPKCCTDQWDGQCVGLANQLCNNLCCGDGYCFAEQCDACVADCGHCTPEPTCPHSLCTGNDNAAPLTTQLCFEPCIDEVCAVIDDVTDNCCEPEPPAWSAECTTKAHALCPEYTCIKDVCAAMPSCCTTHWTAACVEQVRNTPSCATECNCAHSPCAEDNGNQPLAAGCNPCVTAVCAADPYCCNNDWDGYCVSEVGTLCGIVCN